MSVFVFFLINQDKENCKIIRKLNIVTTAQIAQNRTAQNLKSLDT